MAAPLIGISCSLIFKKNSICLEIEPGSLNRAQTPIVLPECTGAATVPRILRHPFPSLARAVHPLTETGRFPRKSFQRLRRCLFSAFAALINISPGVVKIVARTAITDDVSFRHPHLTTVTFRVRPSEAIAERLISESLRRIKNLHRDIRKRTMERKSTGPSVKSEHLIFFNYLFRSLTGPTFEGSTVRTIRFECPKKTKLPSKASERRSNTSMARPFSYPVQKKTRRKEPGDSDRNSIGNVSAVAANLVWKSCKRKNRVRDVTAITPAYLWKYSERKDFHGEGIGG